MHFPPAGAAVLLGAGLLLAAVSPAAALAAPGSSTGSGGAGSGQVGGSSEGGTLSASVEVEVVLTGNGAPGSASGGDGGRATTTISKPPACSWERQDAYDADTFLRLVDTTTERQGRARISRASPLPESDVAAAAVGTEGVWYQLLARTEEGHASTRGGTRTSELPQASVDCLANVQGAGGSDWTFVAAGTEPPAMPPPVLTAEELREVAEQELAVPTPVVATNPELQGFVSLPSWLWVEDGPSPADGFVPLEITATAGQSFATVRAEPDLFTVRSGTGDAACAAEQARTAWAPGSPEDGGCQLVPQRSSAGQPGLAFTVATQTSYRTSWAGATDGVPVAGGALTPVTATESSDLPVAEVQSLVSSAG